MYVCMYVCMYACMDTVVIIVIIVAIEGVRTRRAGGRAKNTWPREVRKGG